MPVSSVTCSVRALNSLHDHDLRTIGAMLALIGGRWSLDRHDDYDGDLSVLLSPLLSPGCDASAGQSFLLHRTAAGIHLVDTTLDGYQPLGTYKALSAALLRLHHLTAATRREQEHRAA